MPCLISTDGKLAVCGGFNRRKYHFFTKRRRAVMFLESLWYEPSLVLEAKRGENNKCFERRVMKKLKFLPKTYESWWRTVAVPQLRNLKGVERGHGT